MLVCKKSGITFWSGEEQERGGGAEEGPGDAGQEEEERQGEIRGVGGGGDQTNPDQILKCPPGPAGAEQREEPHGEPGGGGEHRPGEDGHGGGGGIPPGDLRNR